MEPCILSSSFPHPGILEVPLRDAAQVLGRTRDGLWFGKALKVFAHQVEVVWLVEEECRRVSRDHLLKLGKLCFSLLGIEVLADTLDQGVCLFITVDTQVEARVKALGGVPKGEEISALV